MAGMAQTVEGAPSLTLLQMIIETLKIHLASNPVSRLTWGIEPKNKKRRIQADIHLFTPFLLYAAIVAVLFFPLARMIGISVEDGA